MRGSGPSSCATSPTRPASAPASGVRVIATSLSPVRCGRWTVADLDDEVGADDDDGRSYSARLRVGHLGGSSQ